MNSVCIKFLKYTIKPQNRKIFVILVYYIFTALSSGVAWASTIILDAVLYNNS